MNYSKANLGQLLYMARFTNYRNAALSEIERRAKIDKSIMRKSI